MGLKEWKLAKKIVDGQIRNGDLSKNEIYTIKMLSKKYREKEVKKIKDNYINKKKILFLKSLIF